MPPEDVPLLPPTEPAYEWRACVRDRGENAPSDHVGPFATRDEAERALPDLMNAEPPYDEGWIERRPMVEWERV